MSTRRPVTTQEEVQEQPSPIDVTEEDSNEELPQWATRVAVRRKSFDQWCCSHQSQLRFALYSVVVILYSCYFGYAMHYNFKNNIGLLALTVIVILGIMFNHAKGSMGNAVSGSLQHCSPALLKIKRVGKWLVAGLVVLGLLVYIVLDVRHQPARLVSGAGVFVFLLFAWIFSKDKAKVKGHLVVTGLYIQLFFGLITLRWDKGLQAFEWVGNKFNGFLDYTQYGSKFVFGESYLHHFIAFKSLTTVIFFGAVVLLLYYCHVLQTIIKYLGYVMETIMGIGPVEAFISAANIFLGPHTAVLAIAQLMPVMTMSELHTVLTTSFATVTGALFGIYSSLGVTTSHLIAASVMSAPAALVVSKVMYPEKQKSKLAHVEDIKFPKAEETSAIEAFSCGASKTIPIVASVAVNLVAFVACLTAINAFLTWAGNRVGLVDLSLQIIFSYVFAPIAFFMGVPTTDCLTVGRLLGTKIFANTVIAYSDLGQLIRNREQGLEPVLDPRSEVIATYAMCGFGNFSDLGITLGVIGAIVPSRQSDLVQLALRSMVAGNLACFMTACMAGEMACFMSACKFKKLRK